MLSTRQLPGLLWGLHSFHAQETKKFGYDPKLLPIFNKNIQSATSQKQFYLLNVFQTCPLASLLVVTTLSLVPSISLHSPDLSVSVLTSRCHPAARALSLKRKSDHSGLGQGLDVSPVPT